MEIFNTALIITWKIMCTLGCIMMCYVFLSTLVDIIKKDMFKKREIGRLIKENIDLKEKIQRLEIELVDKELAKEYNDNKRTKNWVLVCFSFPEEKSSGFFLLFYEKCLTY